MEILIGILWTLVVVGGANVLSGWLIWRSDEEVKFFVKPYEVLLRGAFCFTLVERRHPRRLDIRELNRQINSLRDNTSEEAAEERSRLIKELDDLRREPREEEKRLRQLDDRDAYFQLKPAIDRERALRLYNSRQIAESNRALMNARQQSYESQ